MRVTDLDAQIPDQIGHAFGYYDYGEEIGMDSFFRSKDAVADYIAGYAYRTEVLREITALPQSSTSSSAVPASVPTA